MNDHQPLEEMLARLKPAPMGPCLSGRLHDAMDDRLTLRDRLFAAWTGIGALAALLIVSLMVWQLTTVTAPPNPAPADLAAQQKAAAEIQNLLAIK